MQPGENRGALDDIHIQCRLTQITLSLVAFAVSIATVTDGGRYDGGEPNGYLMMASIMCWFDTAALGCIGILSFYRPEDIAWYMVLLFDVLATAASIAAPICVNCNQGYWLRHHRFLQTMANFTWLNLIPVAISILRTTLSWWRSQHGVRVRAWWQEQQARRVYPKSHSDVWTPEEIRKLEKRVEQLETEARARPFTPSETISRWTTYSGGDTLPDYQSQANTIPM